MQTTTRRALLATAMWGLAAAADAQTASSDANAGAAGQTAPPSSGAIAGDIVVTAQKRAERVQDVSAQVNVLTSSNIQALQIRQTPDIVATIPNLTVARTDTYRNSTIVLRSISQANNSDVPVAVIVDGVPQNDPKQFNTRLFDIAQIEVLKGPQGSLYGRNAEAGVIIITTTPPTNDLSGSAQISYGKNATIDGSASISGALVRDRILFRVSGNYFKSDGLVYDAFRGDHPDYVSHDWNVRGSLRFLITDDVKLDLVGQHGDFKAGTTYFTPIFSGNANDYQNPQEGFPNQSFGNSTFLSARLEANLSFATLSSITGYTKNREHQISDVDFTNNVQHPEVFQDGDNQPSHSHVFSQEIRLVGPTGSRLRWFVGADYLSARSYISTNIFIDRGNPASDPTNPAFLLVSNTGDNKRSDYGISGQLDFDLLTKLTLTAGLRYDDDKRHQLNVNTGVTRQASFDKFEPKVTATYKFNSDMRAYATYAVGYRSGGFNQPNFSVPIFTPETLKNVEVGFKSQWLDRRLTINVALFSGHATNYQYSYIDHATASSVTGNIDGVRIRGAELETRLNPIAGLTLYANAGISDPKITKSAAFPLYVGNATPRAQKFSWQTGFDYTVALSDRLSAFARANLHGYSRTYWYIDNLDVQNPKQYVDASVGVKSGLFTVTLWGKNLTSTKANETYFPNQATGAPYDLAYPIKPVSYGVDLAVKF